MNMVSNSNLVTLRTPAGLLQGARRDGLRIFSGIPYALPAVGEARWKPPMPVPPWDNVRNASVFGPASVQPDRKPGSIYADTLDAMDEDCLSLNIWAPEDAESAPVLVWIHGGSLIWGASSEALYDGAKLAGRGIVVVSINYRLGVFGYLAHPELSAESLDDVSGNYGLLDQIAALRWIRDNIAAFGGDPANVTVAGESAGALSVMYLMSAPSARGLFAKAIAQSAYMITTPELRERRFGIASAEDVGTGLAAKLGASGIAGLRAMDARALAKAALDAGFAPSGTVDPHILPRQIVDVFERGEQAPVPLIAGFNSGEIRSLRFLAPKHPENAGAYETAIRERYGDLGRQFLKLYPSGNMDESILAAVRDAMYGWSAERLASAQTAIGVPAYLYLFDHAYPAATEAGLHGFHASEIPYIFGTMDRAPPRWPKAPQIGTEHALSDAMADYWASFAAIGVPQTSRGPEWLTYGNGKSYMRFGQLPRCETDLDPEAFALHDEVVNRRRAAGDTPWNWNVGIVSPPLPLKSAKAGAFVMDFGAKAEVR